MEKKKIKILWLAVLLFLFPYVFTLIYHGKADPISEELPKSGRSVLLADGKTLVDLEQFVLYMAAAQIPEDYGAEALKCQAVLARTYLYREMGEERTIEAGELGAAYLDEAGMEKLWGNRYSENRRKYEEAVLATEGQTLRYEGAYLSGVFHRISAGTTRDGGEAFPYLKAMESPEDIQAEGYLSVRTLSFSEAAKALAAQAGGGFSLSSETLLSQLQIVKRDGAGYVEEVLAGVRTFSGDEIASAFGLPSPCFSWEEYGGNLRITCKGQGHGYGLSQWGAKIKGENGYTYREILSFYFPGAEIP
ncbi:MAG: SpoIID/LytB domain-containing protein [Lachnospiraceae bacterium]|nr:SpoIID/LytB domain-containing protein [Lachnospiraceae bacterium]